MCADVIATSNACLDARCLLVMVFFCVLPDVKSVAELASLRASANHNSLFNLRRPLSPLEFGGNDTLK